MSTQPNSAGKLEPRPARLRDATAAQFEEIYQCDRFTAMVLSNRLRYTVAHMSTGLMFSAFSPIIRDWYDFAITISGPRDMDYPMPAVSSSLLVFLGTMEDAVRNTIEEYGVENLKPGDVLLCNDPYRVGTHVNDTCFIRPVFYQGKPIAFVNARAHQLDMGGVTPGGFSGIKTNVYENGLVLGPMLLFQNDKPVRSTFSLVFDNTRFAGFLQPDFMTMAEQLKLGEKLLLESIERYGEAAFRGTLRYCCDASAEAMSDAIARLPDGIYHAEEPLDADGAGDDEPIMVRATINKRGGRVEVDLSGSSRQARTCINAGPLDAKTAVGAAFKLLLDRHTPFSSGAYRPIDIVVPPGTVMSALPPYGAIMLYWEVSQALLTAILRELGEVIGADAFGGDYGSVAVHNAHGVRADGTPWQNIGIVGGEHGPWGADKHHDGESYTVPYMINGLDPATEAMEQDAPVLLIRKEYVTDSGGAGYNRGGAGVLKDAFWETSGEHYSSPLRLKKGTGNGVQGGSTGIAGACWLFDPEDEVLTAPGKLVPVDGSVYAKSTPIAGVLNPSTMALDPNGDYFYFARQQVWHTRAGAVSRYITNGGGGWGDPKTREPSRVLADVRDGYVSIAGAQALYGVAITGDPEFDPEGLVLDEAATRALRAVSIGKISR
ncbi:MAG: hydantoinase B/oxoprolinase family protein [Gammaproteobacteria bacterium]|nr:hydantoinase B/oxoprolinase family protein [Gammaproteobacteria bacterium]